jgi:hypothetical protein
LPILPPEALHLSHHEASVIAHDSLSESLAVMQHQEARTCAGPPATPGVDVGEWHDLLECYRQLGPTARQVLLMTAKRLAIGRVQYNDDFTDQKRDMIRDGIEEAADLAVYLQVQLTRMAAK